MLGGMLIGATGAVGLMYYCNMLSTSADAGKARLRERGPSRSTYALTHAHQLSGTFLTDLLAALWKHIAEAGTASSVVISVVRNIIPSPHSVLLPHSRAPN